MKDKKLIIVGGGAAGFFAAVNFAEKHTDWSVTILERGKDVLEKVRISGGGRCNVTHHCFEPKELIKNYPRGGKELLGAFFRFHAQHTVEWFENRGVKLKTEPDGRMFPTTDDSETIAKCLFVSAQKAGVKIITSTRVDDFKQTPEGWKVFLGNGEVLPCNALMIATGSNPRIWQSLENLGLDIVPAVPSLFTFHIKDSRLKDLEGISVTKAKIKLVKNDLQAGKNKPQAIQTEGAVLITHWGLSGPAVLRLSAFAAREMAESNYRCSVEVNWIGGKTTEEVNTLLTQFKQTEAKRTLSAHTYFDLPARLWQSLCSAAGIPDTLRWADLSKTQLTALVQQLCHATFSVNGKSVFKEEFVTAGGVALHEIDFKNFESKRFKNLFLAGEVLDIDGVTGGFNFQAAWTGGWHVADVLMC